MTGRPRPPTWSRPWPLIRSLADKVDLQVQVAGPNAQRQIQQINAMVQAGAEAIVVYPISPTALNQVVKNACDKGVKIFAYDGDISEPCAHNISIDQDGSRPCHRRVAGRRSSTARVTS
jgi:DNA-binding NarL/FixJ family response regulator